MTRLVDGEEFGLYSSSSSLGAYLSSSERKKAAPARGTQSPNLVRGGLQLERSRDFYLFIALGRLGGRWEVKVEMRVLFLSFAPTRGEFLARGVRRRRGHGARWRLALCVRWVSTTQKERERERTRQTCVSSSPLTALLDRRSVNAVLRTQCPDQKVGAKSPQPRPQEDKASGLSRVHAPLLLGWRSHVVIDFDRSLLLDDGLGFVRRRRGCCIARSLASSIGRALQEQRVWGERCVVSRVIIRYAYACRIVGRFGLFQLQRIIAPGGASRCGGLPCRGGG